MQIEQLYSLYKQFTRVSTDTRNILPDSLFFALKGANFNGNAFAKQALESGARYAVVDEASFVENDGQYILVEDALETLQALARHHRQQLHIPFVGITGTNGKTTTKELVQAVLSQKYTVFATKGNLNNHIGVPLTLLAIDNSIEVAIIEMGANHVGEIASLCGITQPDYGLITNVGKAHLEGFGSFEGVKKAKGELYDYIAVHHGTLFIQGDNPFLNEMLNQRKVTKVVRYGFSSTGHVSGELVSADPLLTIRWKEKDGKEHQVSTQLTGSYNTENILAAACIGIELGLTPEQINRGIKSYTPKNNRSQITQTEKNTVIADFYNANASSMAAALDNIRAITADKKAIILGDMFEMGEESAKEHKAVIEKTKETEVDLRIFVGQAFYQQMDQEDHYFATTQEARAFLQKTKPQGYTILLKGSRGMMFEKLMEVL